MDGCNVKVTEVFLTLAAIQTEVRYMGTSGLGVECGGQLDLSRGLVTRHGVESSHSTHTSKSFFLHSNSISYF